MFQCKLYIYVEIFKNKFQKKVGKENDLKKNKNIQTNENIERVALSHTHTHTMQQQMHKGHHRLEEISLQTLQDAIIAKKKKFVQT